MKKSDVHGFVSLVFVIVALAVMIATLPVARALTTMGTATAATTVDQNGNCSGGVQYTPVDNVDYRLNSNPDTVRFPYSISWADQRTFSPSNPRATHYFALQTVHNGNTLSTSRTEYTYGGESGSATLSIDVPTVYNGDYVDVTYTANLSGLTGTGCPVLSSVTMHYHFVYP